MEGDEYILTVEKMLQLFSKIRRVYADEFSRIFSGPGYSPNEISVLLFLYNNPSIDTSIQLSTCLGVSRGLICRSVDALTGRGLLESRCDEADKRVQHLKITRKAEPIVADILKAKKQIDREILKGIPPADIQNMETTMQEIIRRFEEKGRDMR